MSNIKIIAEIGCNHNGDVQMAKEMIKKAKESGADAVKFQSFIPEKLVSYYAPKAEYQKNDDGNESQLQMLKRLTLFGDEYKNLVKYASDIDIDIFSTAFDFESLDFLVNMGQSIWKIPSGEINNLPYLERIVNIECQKKVIILSTGMSTINEVECAINILEKSKNTKFIILHCNTQYPTVPSDMNLRVLNTLQKIASNWEVGLSDHSEGILASLISVGMGATVIEKHFTLNKLLPGPDHMASIEPKELKQLCDNIRIAEVMLGCDQKKVTNSERKNIFAARKSIIASQKIQKGEIFTERNITCKRPGNGISPMHWYDILGKQAEKDFSADELIFSEGIKWEDE